MWKNKKKLLFLLAFSSLLIAQNSSDTTPGSDQLESAVTKNISSGLTNQKNYDIIEKALRTRNKELKDLYKQSDYIVKPEYLEWQVFFTGFYEEYNIFLGNETDFGRRCIHGEGLFGSF